MHAGSPPSGCACISGRGARSAGKFIVAQHGRRCRAHLAGARRRETLCVYGDFDADGVSSTALLVSTLQALGRVGPYIPDRVNEGYGPPNDAILPDRRPRPRC
jgi:hypothetical protein